jgi:acetone carboxylase, gamma subunit
MKLDVEMLRDLMDERLARAQVRTIQSGYKDADRFDKYVEILQEQVPWDDQIVLPFGEHLFVVLKDDGEYLAHDERSSSIASAEGSGLAPGRFIIKCDCGHEFCDYRENWKLEALVYVRETAEDMLEIYPDKMHGDPAWNVLREYFCPGCKTLLEVEAVPRGYPVIHDFVPDLEGFYEEWLGRPLPT